MDATDRSSLPRRPPTADERQQLPLDVRDLPALDLSAGDILDHGLREIGLELSEAQREAIEAHVRLLLAWNAHINLSGLRSADEVARGHVLDALLAVLPIRALTRTARDGSAGVTLLDLGSGGGYPGLPLAIALPARRAALVDSIAKKAAFLEAAAGVVTDTLRGAPADPPDIVALAERAEDLADEPDHRAAWDLVVARAVGTIAEVAELGLPLAHRGGHVVAWKRAAGAADDPNALEREIGQARRIIQAAGGAGVRIIVLEAAERIGLPGNCLVVIRKVRPTPDRYPRSPGERRRGTLP
ncbi:MAG TPA: 16S rRNA (guanine(527)-N(7))-methyltransferase RsmG [Candidatus Limnocylindrales bacterium]